MCIHHERANSHKLPNTHAILNTSMREVRMACKHEHDERSNPSGLGLCVRAGTNPSTLQLHAAREQGLRDALEAPSNLHKGPKSSGDACLWRGGTPGPIATTLPKYKP